MYATQRLPAMLDLKQLASDIARYPVSGLGVSQIAEHLGYADDVIEFTKQFSPRIIFSSKTNFLHNCRLLEWMMREEEKSSVEFLRSPQD